MGNDLLLVVFQFPEAVEGYYYARMEGIDFFCETLPEYPDRLYCNGDNTKAGQQVVFEIFTLEGDELVYSEEFFVPQLPTATPKPAKQTGNTGGDEGDAPQPTDDNEGGGVSSWI